MGGKLSPVASGNCVCETEQDLSSEWQCAHAPCTTSQQALGHMRNRGLAAAYNAWWGAVLRKREVQLLADQLLLRMKNRELAQGMDAFKAHAAWREKKRRADKHFFDKHAPRVGFACGLGFDPLSFVTTSSCDKLCTIVGSIRHHSYWHHSITSYHAMLCLLVSQHQVLQGWRYAVKLGLAIDLWTGNTLRLTFSQWQTVIKGRVRMRITAGAQPCSHCPCACVCACGPMALGALVSMRFDASNPCRHCGPEVAQPRNVYGLAGMGCVHRGASVQAACLPAWPFPLPGTLPVPAALANLPAFQPTAN